MKSNRSHSGQPEKEDDLGRGMGIGGAAVLIMILMLTTAGNALAHCDTLDGPVVTLARQALDRGDVKLILPWVAADRRERSGRRST